MWIEAEEELFDSQKLGHSITSEDYLNGRVSQPGSHLLFGEMKPEQLGSFDDNISQMSFVIPHRAALSPELGDKKKTKPWARSRREAHWLGRIWAEFVLYQPRWPLRLLATTLLVECLKSSGATLQWLWRDAMLLFCETRRDSRLIRCHQHGSHISMDNQTKVLWSVRINNRNILMMRCTRTVHEQQKMDGFTLHFFNLMTKCVCLFAWVFACRSRRKKSLNSKWCGCSCVFCQLFQRC